MPTNTRGPDETMHLASHDLLRQIQLWSSLNYDVDTIDKVESNVVDVEVPQSSQAPTRR